MRSPASVAQRLAYGRAWRASHPDYYRARRIRKGPTLLAQKRRWRADHPELVRAMRRRYAIRHPTAPTESLPSLHTGHPLFEAAKAVVGPNNTTLLFLVDPLREDLISEAVLALLERRDPYAAVQAYGAREKRWRRVTGPLLPWAFA